MNSKSMRVLYPSVSVEFPPIFTCLLLSVYPMSSLLLDILFQLPFPFLVTKCEHRNDEWFSHPFPSVFIPTPRGPYVNMRLMIPVFRVLSYKISSPNTQNTNGTACLNLIMCQKLHPTHKTNNNLTDRLKLKERKYCHLAEAGAYYKSCEAQYPCVSDGLN